MGGRTRPDNTQEPGLGTDHVPAALGLAELTGLAGVSVRTVRYYIAEGLLPPPVGAGPRASYTGGHLDRLRLIGRLKAAYLPLREIRRRLRDLDDDEVRALLAEATGAEPPAGDAGHAGPRSRDAPDDSAAAYLARLLPPDRTQPRPRPRPRDGSARRASVGLPGRPAEQFDAPDVPPPPPSAPPDAVGNPARLTRADLDRGAALTALTARSARASFDPDAADAWHRIGLGDDAELLIRADAHGRQREQIDALVAWARRVLG